MNFFITVNKREIEAVKGETILQALRRAGISIPTLCNMEGFTPTGACRICVVEVTGKEDLVPACSFPVEEWMEIQTHTLRVIKARKMIVELLLSSHPDDCLYCERNCHCELQNLAFEHNIRERKHSGKKNNSARDLTSPAIIRDPAKCILCGRCVRVCEETMACTTLEFSGKGQESGITTTSGKSLNRSTCITCGQCIIVCPTSALYEKTNVNSLQLMFGKADIYPVAVIDPVVNITLAEINGNKNVHQFARQLNTILQKSGFKEVYDLASVTDLYIKKTAEEVISNSENNIPVLSSSCPAWIKYAEQFMHDSIKYISKIKSPSQLAGSILKGMNSISSKEKELIVVSISPCTARKFEAAREEFNNLQGAEIDLVITTRALQQFINLNGLDINKIEPEEFNKPFNTSSMHGELTGICGGTMEAVASTVYHNITGGEELKVSSKIKKNRLAKGLKEISFTVNDKKYMFAAISGMADARAFLSEALKTPGNYSYIEIMACPMGCVNGGGQPLMEDRNKSRQKLTIEIAEKNALTSCNRNRTLDDPIKFIKDNEDKIGDIIRTTYKSRTLY